MLWRVCGLRRLYDQSGPVALGIIFAELRMVTSHCNINLHEIDGVVEERRYCRPNVILAPWRTIVPLSQAGPQPILGLPARVGERHVGCCQGLGFTIELSVIMLEVGQ